MAQAASLTRPQLVTGRRRPQPSTTGWCRPPHRSAFAAVCTVVAVEQMSPGSGQYGLPPLHCTAQHHTGLVCSRARRTSVNLRPAGWVGRSERCGSPAAAVSPGLRRCQWPPAGGHCSQLLPTRSGGLPRLCSNGLLAAAAACGGAVLRMWPDEPPRGRPAMLCAKPCLARQAGAW